MHRQLPAGPRARGGSSDKAAASSFYIGDPRVRDARAVKADPSGCSGAGCMGTGLTTADLLISLEPDGHRGPVTALLPGAACCL